MTTIVEYDTAPTLTGFDLGWTTWLEVTQERIDMFAEATGDHQWIHVDPVRAATGPFGAPIAHGFLTLALVADFWSELFDIEGVSAKVNYGLDRVRFVSPVTVGSRLRMHAVIVDVEPVEGGWQFTVDQTVAVQGAVKPALVARSLYRFLR